MGDGIAEHYSQDEGLAGVIAAALERAGRDLDTLTTADLATVDEFHIRGRKATQELAAEMGLTAASRVLDIGSGLGGPARTLAETARCHVTGIDLTPAFCEAANEMSRWTRLSDLTRFQQGDATALPFDDASFDAAMTVHVAMNIARKDLVYAEARRVLKKGGHFAVYDVLQGEGGPVHYPVPWARDASISHLATPEEMRTLLTAAGFRLVTVSDSTDEAQAWFAARLAQAGVAPPPVSFQTFLGDDYPLMMKNQVANLTERRIRTVTYICQA